MIKKRGLYTEEIIEALCKGQNITPEELNEIRVKHSEMPDGILVCFILIYFTRNSQTTNWPLLLRGIEELLERNADEEQMRIVTQDVLEGIANTISNETLDPKLIEPHLGPKSRKYIQEYEAFMEKVIQFNKNFSYKKDNS